jgi:hypothetical protein
MSVNANSNLCIDSPNSASSADYNGANYRSNRSSSDILMDTTDDSMSVNSTSSRATIIDTNPNYHTSSNDKKGCKNDNSL